MPMQDAGEFRVGQFSDGEMVAYHQSWLAATEPQSILLFSDRSLRIECYDREHVLSLLHKPTSDLSAAQLLRNLKATLSKDGRSFIYRKTHCFSCSTEIDSFHNVRCNACGWLICDCGGCNCDRREEIR
jgi:hypothetical protein